MADGTDSIDPFGPGRAGMSRPLPLVGVLATLAVSNVVANELLPDWAYVPWNCGVAASLVAIAIGADGCTLDDLGLGARRAPSGLRWGAAVSGGLLAVYLAAIAAPATRELFSDDRTDIALPAMLVQAMVVVPLGTVLMEEVAFRGVLPAMFRRRFGPRRPGGRIGPELRADVAAAVLFGLWHVLPTWNVNEVNPVFRDLLPGAAGRAVTIAGGVLGTAAAGMGFSWLRNRSGSLAAPAMLHWSTNSLGYVLGWLVQRGSVLGQ